MKDIDVREALQRTHLRKFEIDGNSRIISEMDICNGEARIDIAIINGHLHGIEIKSEQDTLARLSHQVCVYSKVFDYLTLVVADSHIDAARKMLPDTWGITQATMQKVVSLKVIRRPRINKGTQPIAICQFLWKEELVALLTQHKLPFLPQRATKFEICQFLADSIKSSILAKDIREILKARKAWRVAPQSRQSGGSSQRRPKLSGFQAHPLF